MRFKRSLMALVTGVVMAAFVVALPGTSFAAEDFTTANDVVVALENVNAHTRLVVDAAPSSNVAVPSDPKQGVQVKLPNGQKMTIGLPNADTANKASKTRKGVTAYAGRGAANAVIETASGVQMLTTIESPEAPTSYAYPFSLTSGERLELAAAGGGVIIFDARRAPIGVVAPPWAKDAAGRDIPTHFTTDGKTLVQHVAHKAKGVQYPVVADPSFGWNWGPTVWFTRGETQFLITAGGTIWLAAIVGMLTGGWIGPAIVATLVEAARAALRSNQCLAITWVAPWFYQC